MLAFIIGLSIYAMERSGRQTVMRQLFEEFEALIDLVIARAILPLLPVYVFGNFLNLSYGGAIANILWIFGLLLVLLIVQHYVYLLFLYGVAATQTETSFVDLVRNQIPAHLMAFGTESSATSIPVNIEGAKQDGVLPEVVEFALPLTATMHMCGSVISVSTCVMEILMMNEMDYSAATMLPFYLALGLILVAGPGIPGGAVMAALLILPMVGIESEGVLASLLITMYLTQDSFGTSTNVSANLPLALIIDRYYRQRIKGQKA